MRPTFNVNVLRMMMTSVLLLFVACIVVVSAPLPPAPVEDEKIGRKADEGKCTTLK